MTTRPIQGTRHLLRTLRNVLRYIWLDRWRFTTRPAILILRFRLRRRLDRLQPGATILIANWQTGDFLRTTIPQVLRNSPAGTALVVVDNASTDSSREVLRNLPPPVRVIRLPVNVGHGVALDIAAMTAASEYIVALDVDAFPISNDWIQRLMDPLEDGQRVSGAGASNGQIAPCCLMISVRRFIENRHTFTSRLVPGNEPLLRPELQWDVGRRISMKEGTEALHRFERTTYLEPDQCVGEIFDRLVFHNGYATVGLLPHERGSTSQETAWTTWERAQERWAKTD